MPARHKNPNPKRHTGGWAGRNPEAYHGMTAAMSFMTTLVGTVIAGHYLTEWSGKAWIIWVAITWGFGGGLWILLRRLKQIEELYGKKKDPPHDRDS